MYNLYMKKGFLIYKSLYEPIKSLTRNQKGELLEAIFEYQTNGIIIKDISPIVNMAFMFFKNQFDIDSEKYAERCLKAKESVQKRWNTKECDSIPTYTNVYERIRTNTNDTDKRNKIQDNDNDDDKEEEYSFSEFWDLYSKKNDRSKCEKAWKKLTAKELEAIKTVLPIYIKSTPDIQYRKNPLTWINGKCWNDEGVEKQKVKKKLNTSNLTF